MNAVRSSTSTTGLKTGSDEPRRTGPCLRLELVTATSHRSAELELRARWEEAGAAIVRAGYRSVRAFPLRRQEVVFGGLDVFGGELHAQPAKDAPSVGQAFADLAGRAVIEQARGVLAYQLTVEVARAYDVLLERAQAAGVTVTAQAQRTVAAAQTPGRTE